MTREFHRFCDHWGIYRRPVQTFIEGRPSVWECVSSVDALERLAGHPSVADFHYILDTPVPRGGQGAGEVTDRVRKAISRDRLPKADRLAWEENDRRARLSREQQQDIELAEARARAAAL